MKQEIQLEKMTISEKLDTMEKLWESLRNEPEEIPSPQWHKTILEKRHKEVQKNPNKFTDFEEAKKALIDIIEYLQGLPLPCPATGHPQGVQLHLNSVI